MQEPTWPSYKLQNVTPSNSTTYPEGLRQLYVGTGGDVSITDQSGITAVFKNVMDGSTIGPFYAVKVNATGTTASNIIGFF